MEVEEKPSPAADARLYFSVLSGEGGCGCAPCPGDCPTTAAWTTAPTACTWLWTTPTSLLPPTCLFRAQVCGTWRCGVSVLAKGKYLNGYTVFSFKCLPSFLFCLSLILFFHPFFLPLHFSPSFDILVYVDEVSEAVVGDPSLRPVMIVLMCHLTWQTTWAMQHSPYGQRVVEVNPMQLWTVWSVWSVPALHRSHHSLLRVCLSGR